MNTRYVGSIWSTTIHLFCVLFFSFGSSLNSKAALADINGCAYLVGGFGREFTVSAPGGTHVGQSWTINHCAPASVNPWNAEVVPGVAYDFKITSSVFDHIQQAAPTFSVPCYGGSITGGQVDAHLWQWTIIIAPQNLMFTWDIPKRDGRYILRADGQSRAVPSPTQPGLGSLTWEFIGDSLGCQLDATTGVITASNKVGTVTVKATMSSGVCYQESLDLETCNKCVAGTCEGISLSASIANGVEVNIGLGTSLLGGTAGQLQVTASGPEGLLATPAQLQYPFKRPESQTKFDANDAVKQIQVRDGIANVVISNNYSYRVEFHSLTNVVALTNDYFGTHEDYFELENSPISVFTFENPSNDTNRLRVTQTRDGSDTVYDYAWITNGWQLTTGNGLRTEIVTTALSETNTLKTVVTKVQYSNDPPVFQKTEKFRIYSFGERLIEESFGTGPNSITNAYTYLTNGYLQQVVRGSGSWEYYVYDESNRPTNIFSSFGNQSVTTNRSLCRLTENVYSTNVIAGAGDTGFLEVSMPRLRVEYLLGEEIRRTYFVATPGERREIQCVIPASSWSNAQNLVTVTKLFTNGFYQNEMQSILRPDGTAEIYQYGLVTTATNVTTTNIVLRGHPNDSNCTNIDSGNRTVLVYDALDNLLSKTVQDVPSEIVLLSETYAYDGHRRLTNTTFLDGTSLNTTYDCCSVSSTTDRDGTITSYTYDALKRILTTTRAGTTTSNVYDGYGNTLRVLRFGSNPTVITNVISTFDDAGQLTSSKDALNNLTSYTNYVNGSGEMVRITTSPDSTTRIETQYRDGSIREISGTGVHPVRYAYGVESESGAQRAFTQEIKPNGSSTNEWVKTYSDMLGRAYRASYSDGAAALSYFNNAGQLTNQVDPDGISTLYQYNSLGEAEYTVLNMDGNAGIGFAGTDRITQTVRDVVNNGMIDVQRTRTYVWPTITDSSNLVSTTEVSTDGLHQWETRWNGATPITSYARTRYVNGFVIVTNKAAAGVYVVVTNQNGRVLSTTTRDSADALVAHTSFGYDGHGRQVTSTDARNGTTTNAYDNADQLSTLTTPPPGMGQSAQTTTTHYDSMGRVQRVVLPDTASVTNEYHLTGELKKNYGARIYPVEYKYDGQGRLTNMTTWTTYPSTGAANTTWKYDSYRGFLTNKLYADAKGPIYTYTAAGRLRTRVWARGTTTTYTTNAAGEVATVVYSDGTPSLTNSYDRLGRLTSVVYGTNNAAIAYGDAGQLLSEMINGLIVTNTYDSYLRRNGNALNGQASTLVSYGYDAASRLASVTNGSYTAAYAYHGNSMLVSNITFAQSGMTRMTTAKSYDNLNRLTRIVSTPSSGPTIAFDYAYNSVNQRTGVTNSDSRWMYGYDSIGQVISGKKFWTDGTPVAGQQFEYSFDDIGNRKYSASGGDNYGANLRYSHYTADNVNQYIGRTVPNSVSVIGSATNSATVTINDMKTSRKNDYYHAEVLVDNTTAAVYQSITNLAVINQGGSSDIVTNVNGNLFVPKTPEAFSYDADGNLTNDGRWVYTWDAESRLVAMTNAPSIPQGARMKVAFDYDYRSRRATKVAHTWSGSGCIPVSTNRFVYDGWDLIAELNHSNGLVRSYIWGIDLSGRKQGAGGAGGLVGTAITDNGAHFAAFDGNGNVSTLVNASNGSLTATYEYNPFGEVIRIDGAVASLNPMRFSTKYQDTETDLAYYGYRYYDAGFGRWLSRDPIDEKGGINLFSFANNRPLMLVDRLGLDPVGDWISDIYWDAWWNQMRWEDVDGVQYRDDGKGNTMATRTRGHMNIYYKSLALREIKDGKVSCDWQTFKIPKGPTSPYHNRWSIARKNQRIAEIDFSDAGFWLNEAHEVYSHGGTYELRWNPEKEVYQYRNTTGRFRWADRIDSNSNRNDPYLFQFFETVNEAIEWISAADFDVHIDWQDNQTTVQDIK